VVCGGKIPLTFLLAGDDLPSRAKGDLLKKFLLPAFLRQ